MKLKDLLEQYGEYDVEEWFEIGTDGVADEKGIKLKKPKPKPKTVWDLENDEAYFWTFGNGIITGRIYGKSHDIPYIECGNAFLTKEEAEKDLERRKVETLLLKHGGRRWYKDNEDNFVIRYATEEKMLWVDSVGLPVQGTIYFDSIGDAMNAMRENGEIGAERIIKALFEVR